MQTKDWHWWLALAGAVTLGAAAQTTIVPVDLQHTLSIVGTILAAVAGVQITPPSKQ